jgi:general nucleoside transport system ATP-binding protein
LIASLKQEYMDNLSVLEISNITKSFPGVLANDHISISFAHGEVHAVLGENGAGKTTLMNIIYGLYQPDEGEIRIDGQVVRVNSPSDALKRGIGMVHQHFMLVDPLTVAENVVIGNEPSRLIFSMKKTAQITSDLSKKYGLVVDPRARIEDLPVGIRQRVEILKALYRNASILILDEPTAVLTPTEVNELYETISNLKAAGKTIIFITHKLNETMKISDRITILRDGKAVKTLHTSQTNPQELARLMVGRDVVLRVNKTTCQRGAPVVSLENVKALYNRGREAIRGISLKVYAGEIYGIAGIEGNGQTELIEAITGLRKVTEGKIVIDNKDMTNAHPSAILEAGLGHVPEDRNIRGVVQQYSVAENLILGYHRQSRFKKFALLNQSSIEEFSKSIVEAFNIKTTSVRTRIDTLSGGNAQKVVVARVLSQQPNALVVAQPTRGVDVGATEYIHQQMLKMRDAGVAILLISSDLEEVRSLSDRIGVLYQGQIVAERPVDKFTEKELGLFMAGVSVDVAPESIGG